MKLLWYIGTSACVLCFCYILATDFVTENHYQNSDGLVNYHRSNIRTTFPGGKRKYHLVPSSREISLYVNQGTTLVMQRLVTSFIEWQNKIDMHHNITVADPGRGRWSMDPPSFCAITLAYMEIQAPLSASGQYWTPPHENS